MKRSKARLVSALAAAWFAGVASATSVSPSGEGARPVLTDLGSFAAGVYRVEATGEVDLMGVGMAMRPDGTPVQIITMWPQYANFNPSGAYTADGVFGVAESNAKIGALIGTLNPSPSRADDWFLIGASTVVTLNAAGHVYAAVNDTYYNNNVGAFQVTVSAVPESGALAMFGTGLLAMAYRRKPRPPGCRA